MLLSMTSTHDLLCDVHDQSYFSLTINFFDEYRFFMINFMRSLIIV